MKLLNFSSPLRKRMTIMVIILIIVFGGLILFNIARNIIVKHFLANFEFPPAVISTTTAQTETWQPNIPAIGTLVAINGVDVTPEVSGMVVAIFFQSGQMVKKGQPLVQLDTSTDVQDLKNYQSQLTLAQLDYKRQTDLFKTRSTSQQALDNAQATLQQSEAIVQKTQVLISQKTVKAPFDGKIGIRQVNIGQYVTPGNPLVDLQSYNPIRVQFSLPEQNFKSLYFGQPIEMTVDAYKDEVFRGTVTAIDAAVNTQTRNITIEPTIPNEQMRLVPGMFAYVNVILPKKENVVTLPQTAVAYTLYGDSVFVVEKQGKDKKGNPILIAKRRFVVTGDRRKDKIAITKGLKAGEIAITSGQLKLDDGTRVEINNKVQLEPMTAQQLESAN